MEDKKIEACIQRRSEGIVREKKRKWVLLDQQTSRENREKLSLRRERKPGDLVSSSPTSYLVKQ